VDEAAFAGALEARLAAGLARAALPHEALDEEALSPEAAREAGLVDGLAMGSEAALALEETLEGPVRLRRRVSPYGPQTWRDPRRVGVVLLDGSLVDGEAEALVDAGLPVRPASVLVDRIEELARDDSVRAIVV